MRCGSVAVRDPGACCHPGGRPAPGAGAGRPRPRRAQPPVFGVGVDVVAVDASVVDADGRPVLGLGPEDFRVEVDGKPRRLVSVEYVGRDLEPPAPPRARPAHFSSNEDAPRGRLVLLLVDRGNIGRGRGREVLKAAERFLDTLAPGDRVGLAFVPGPGRAIEFTPERRRRPAGPEGSGGQADRGGYRVPLAEAVSHVQLNDRMRWQQFLEAQCGAYMSETRRSHVRPPSPFAQARMEQCNRSWRTRPRSSTWPTASGPSPPSRPSGATFRRASKRIEGPKTLVFISEGLGTESPAEVRDLADRRLAGAGDALRRPPRHVLGADASFNYSASRHPGGPGGRDGGALRPRRAGARGRAAGSWGRGRPPSSGSRAR